MSIGNRIGIGRGGAGGRWPRVRLRRPTGIRNGGLLLVLVALAAVLALVDRPPEPGAGRRLPGVFQYLPPPVGIAQTPPVVDQPPPAAVPTAAPAGDGERPASADRAHPRRAHPRPVAAGSRASGSLASDVVVKPVRDPGGSGGTRPPVTQPPVTTPPVTTPPVTTPPVTTSPVARVRVGTPGTTVDVAAGLTALP